jgi:ribonuclease P protein subunit RPR2
VAPGAAGVIRVLVADDSTTNRAAVRIALAEDPAVEIVSEAANGEEAVELARSLRPDVVLMDVDMPVLDGIGATAAILASVPGARVVALTASDEQETVIAMIEAGASSYVVKGGANEDLRRAITAAAGRGWVDDRVVPKVFEEVVRLYHQERIAAARLAEANTELRREQDKLAELTRGVVRALAAAVEARDEYTGGHIDRVSRAALLLTERVAPELAGDPRVEFGYLLHDVGKLGIPDSILLSTGPLDGEELAVMRSHVEIGVRLLEPIPDFEPVREIVRCHHERWDGSGYPAGLRREEIPLPARLFSVCDAFDAMTTDRPYQRARSVEAALVVLKESAGTQFDPVAAHELTLLVQAGTVGRAAGRPAARRPGASRG